MGCEYTNPWTSNRRLHHLYVITVMGDPQDHPDYKTDLHTLQSAKKNHIFLVEIVCTNQVIAIPIPIQSSANHHRWIVMLRNEIHPSIVVIGLPRICQRVIRKRANRYSSFYLVASWQQPTRSFLSTSIGAYIYSVLKMFS